MKILDENGLKVLTNVYNTITLETREGKRLYICMRDYGFEMKLNDGDWTLVNEQDDLCCIKCGRKKKLDNLKQYDEKI